MDPEVYYYLVGRFDRLSPSRKRGDSRIFTSPAKLAAFLGGAGTVDIWYTLFNSPSMPHL
jgi:hypothetical protein